MGPEHSLPLRRFIVLCFLFLLSITALQRAWRFGSSKQQFTVMEHKRSMKGFGERVMDSARSLGKDMLGGGGGGLERDFSGLTLMCGKAGMTAPHECSTTAFEKQSVGRHAQRPRTSAAIRSEGSARDLEDEFENFAVEQPPLSNLEYDGEDLLEHFDLEKFMSQDLPGSWGQFSSKYLPGMRSGVQCSGSSARELPTEVRLMALDRLRQIEGHLASTSAAAKAADAQRRVDLENEWLLWWDESPTGCFDDSRDYFADAAQKSYTEAWQKHLSDSAPMAIHRPYIERSSTPVPHPPSALPMQQQGTCGVEDDARRCPDQKSHVDSTACGRSTPIAAQHRPCPHAGCGYCSISSAGWFEHVRFCNL